MKTKLSVYAPVWAAITYSALIKSTTPLKAEAMRAFLPYCLQRGEPFRVMIVNRDYKPLGYDGRVGWCDYETPEYKPFRLLRAEFAVAAARGYIDEHGYLFKDGSAPWANPTMLHEYRKRAFGLIAPYMAAT